MASFSQTIRDKVVLFIQIFSTHLSSYFVIMKWKNQTSSIWVSPIDLDMNFKNLFIVNKQWTCKKYVTKMQWFCVCTLRDFQWYKKYLIWTNFIFYNFDSNIWKLASWGKFDPWLCFSSLLLVHGFKLKIQDHFRHLHFGTMTHDYLVCRSGQTNEWWQDYYY